MDKIAGSDIDGTLLDYGAKPGATPVVATGRIAMLAHEYSGLSLITNQAGLLYNSIDMSLGRDYSKYPSVENFTDRVEALVSATNGVIDIVDLRVSVFRAGIARMDRKVISDVATELLEHLRRQGFGFPVFVYSDEWYRKPSPGMIVEARVSAYYGDSDEDELAASGVTGCTFVRLPRFFGKNEKS